MACVTTHQNPQNRVSARLSAIAESATLAVDAKAKALKAKGENVIGFGAGEPDFPTPERIVEAAVRAARDPKFHRYTPAAGLPELREAIAVKTKRDSGFICDASQVLVTNGGKHAVFVAFAALCDPGDEVIIPAPYWTTYPEAVALADGVSVIVDTTEETDFKVTVAQLEKVRTARTKVLLFVSPDNPSGAVYTPEETIAIGKWAVQHGIWVITDEIYEHLTYGKHKFSSMPTLVPEIADKCIIVNGVAKTYAMTGWRVGWMIGPKDVMKAAINFQSHTTSNVSNVAQRHIDAQHVECDSGHYMHGATRCVLLFPKCSWLARQDTWRRNRHRLDAVGRPCARQSQGGIRTWRGLRRTWFCSIQFCAWRCGLKRGHGSSRSLRHGLVCFHHGNSRGATFPAKSGEIPALSRNGSSNVKFVSPVA
jgi:aspartate/methionine/tyrosine aminotransferase